MKVIDVINCLDNNIEEESASKSYKGTPYLEIKNKILDRLEKSIKKIIFYNFETITQTLILFRMVIDNNSFCNYISGFLNLPDDVKTNLIEVLNLECEGFALYMKEMVDKINIFDNFIPLPSSIEKFYQSTIEYIEDKFLEIEKEYA